MISVHRALRVGHSAVTRYAPSEVTVYEVTYAAEDDPRDTTSQATVTAHRIRGVFEPTSEDKEPVDAQVTVSGTLSYRKTSLGHVVTQADRVEIGGVVFNVTDSREVAGAVVVASLSGPAVTPVESGDLTPPRVTAGSLTSPGSGEVRYQATINEASEWRVRFRTPPNTGVWSTGDWQTPAASSVDVTLTGFDSGFWEFAIQPRDAAGNVGAWYDLGEVQVFGIGGS